MAGSIDSATFGFGIKKWRRERILEYIYNYFRLSDSDKDWWKEKESQIPKPFAWKTNLGVYSMKSNFGAALNLFCMIAGVSLAGVFAGEKSRFTPSSSAPEAPSEASWSYMRCRL